MSKIKLKNILSDLINEELQGYSKYIGKTKGLTSDELSQILTKIVKSGSKDKKEEDLKEGEETEYTVDYWYRYGKYGEDKDSDDIKVMASSETEAIEKAKQQSRKRAISSSFEIRKRK